MGCLTKRAGCREWKQAKNKSRSLVGSKAGEMISPNLFESELILSYAPGTRHDATRSGDFHAKFCVCFSLSFKY